MLNGYDVANTVTSANGHSLITRIQRAPCHRGILPERLTATINRTYVRVPGGREASTVGDPHIYAVAKDLLRIGDDMARKEQLVDERGESAAADLCTAPRTRASRPAEYKYRHVVPTSNYVPEQTRREKKAPPPPSTGFEFGASIA